MSEYLWENTSNLLQIKQQRNQTYPNLYVFTWKKDFVLPESTIPYWISVCFARSSADSIGVNILSTVKKAAKLAVYEEIMISVKNHHTLPTILPDTDL